MNVVDHKGFRLSHFLVEDLNGHQPKHTFILFFQEERLLVVDRASSIVSGLLMLSNELSAMKESLFRTSTAYLSQRFADLQKAFRP